jgi:hypothetical protein
VREGRRVELGELVRVVAARAALDERELRLIDQARRDGATWAEIASAMGLASRQAAEQRRQRLAAAVARAESMRRDELDFRYGDDIAALRAATVALRRRLEADPRWDQRFVRAALVRSTVAAAAEAGPGPLFALVAQAVTDIADSGVTALPSATAAAVAQVRKALRAAVPA